MKKRTMILAGVLSLTMITPVFAGPTHSFCVGAEMTTMSSTSGAIDTAQDAFDVAWNLAYAGYVPQLVLSKIDDEEITLNSDTVTFDRLNSGVVYLASHGTNDGKQAIWVNNNTDLNYRLVNNVSYVSGRGLDVSDGNYSNTKLAIIGACYCGLTGGVAQAFQQQGADCAVGWTVTVDNGTIAAYMRHLTTHLAAGMTVSEAIKEANVTVLDDLPDKDYDTSFRNYKTYGSGVHNSIKINSSTAANLAVLNSIGEEYGINAISEDKDGLYNPETYQRPTDSFINVESENIEYRNSDDTEIVSYIKEYVDSNFNKELFEKTEIETIPGDDSDMIITYRYKVGDVVSDFGYNINIEDYKMIGYKETGTSLYNFAVPATILADDMKESKLEAYNASLMEMKDSVKEQNVDVTFDSKSKQFEYFVKTVYETEDGGIYAVREKVQ